jgi:isopentenyl phosphate kinase
MTPIEPVTLLKLGGSVITKKDQPETLNEINLRDAATIISNFRPKNLIVVHGGGSFGHHHASNFNVTIERGTRSATEVDIIHSSMVHLCDIVTRTFRSLNIPAIPIHPLSVAWRDSNSILHFPSQHVLSLLENGFVPVVHGDLIITKKEGVTVVSGDELVTNLSNSIPTKRIGFCTSTPGVLDAFGNVISHLSPHQQKENSITHSSTIDVTGGMAGKVSELANASSPVSIFDLPNLETFLKGNDPGTLIQ